MRQRFPRLVLKILLWIQVLILAVPWLSEGWMWLAYPPVVDDWRTIRVLGYFTLFFCPGLFIAATLDRGTKYKQRGVQHVALLFEAWVIYWFGLLAGYVSAGEPGDGSSAIFALSIPALVAFSIVALLATVPGLLLDSAMGTT